MSVLLLSDLHLDANKPNLVDIFVRFLRGPARTAEAVYLLGDIFEVWIGDDDPSPLPARIALELNALAQTGTAIFFMHGNRDFLLRREYADSAGMKIIEDPAVAVIGGTKTILAHGDRYCVDDIAYQAFRVKSRDPAWQAKVLGWPLWRRRMTARIARYMSKRSYQKKLKETGDANQIADVSVPAIMDEFSKLGARRMIHGHTHRPADHVYDSEGGNFERIVLSDWRESGEALEVLDDGTIKRHVLE